MLPGRPLHPKKLEALFQCLFIRIDARNNFDFLLTGLNEQNTCPFAPAMKRAFNRISPSSVQ